MRPPLMISDIGRHGEVLKAFKTLQMVIYNYGANAGSFKDYRHLQLFPLRSSRSQA